MATEPAADSELSVTLPPSLAEWLEERASALGIEREALLVELLETHRSTAEIGDDGLVSLLESADVEAPTLEPALEDIDDRVGTLEERLDGIDDRTENADSRVDDVEAKLANNVEDIRKRVLQLRDALEERAPAEHSHGEFEAVSDRLDAVSAELEAVDEEMGSTTDRIETIEGKLDRLARAVVSGKRRSDHENDSKGVLNEISRTANRNGAADADCAACGESVRIGLLSESACPYCERRFRALETPASLFRWFKRPVLTVAELADEETPEGDVGGVDGPERTPEMTDE